MQIMKAIFSAIAFMAPLAGMCMEPAFINTWMVTGPGSSRQRCFDDRVFSRNYDDYQVHEH